VAATVFLVDAVPAPGAEYLLDGDEGRHAAVVRRIRVGEAVVLSDGAGCLASCTVTAVAKASVTLSCESVATVPPPSPRVVLVQAIPKSDRADLAVELATEAGIDEIIPWQAARCVARWDKASGKADKGAARWRAVARAAAKQARRAWIPAVREVVSSSELIRVLASMDAKVVVLHEGSATSLAACDFSVASTVVIVVGPEGGIAPDEVDALVATGATTALLGPTVLRTSTAAAVALGAIGAMTDRWAATPPS
jgi:16S rRNA (uracil1498-N3)-methyltransferase